MISPAVISKSEENMNKYLVNPNEKVNLKDWDPEDHTFFEGEKKEAKEKIAVLTGELEQLQELLFAEHKHKLLIILQAMDTGGKDGVISHVFEGVNPQGVKVASFKVPTQEELDHDYLWRVHKQVPGKGEIMIFNRSHYEDVLVVRVHALVPKKVWSKRYSQINNFERMISEEGTSVLKFFLHIDKDEQKKRLQARLDDPQKHWKFNPGDLKERERWDDYSQAYEDMLSKTSTQWAPWYVIPANHKWYRNLVIASILVEKLKNLKMKYPEPGEDLSQLVID
jgi:PPK2 family polyphosphate:nucleotide phosphotransferase